MGLPLWEADKDRMKASRLFDFMQVLPRLGGPDAVTYADLHDFSVREPERFWSAIWDYFGIKGAKGNAPWLARGARLSASRFFPEGRLNYAENALATRGPGKALVFWGEDKVKRSHSWDELRLLCGRMQGWLQDAGMGPLDRMGAVMPNMPESVAAFLGCAAQGVTWSACSPDFGEQGIVDRLGQIAPRTLLVCDGYYYSGKTIDIGEKVVSVVRSLPSVEKVIVVDYIGRAKDVASRLAAETAGRDVETWHAAIDGRPAREPDFTPLPFSHPVYILFSSGTTGVPKCIMHGAGGALLKHYTEVALHSDVRPGDRLFYFSTLGWMMWNWLISGLAAGATLLLYDGNPTVGGSNILFDYAEAEGCTHFGTSAKFIDTLSKMQLSPAKTHALAPLRAILSTGSPLSPESFDYVYASIKKDVHLASMSGGTDLLGCFVCGNPLLPVWRGEIQCSTLGMATDVVDEEGVSMQHGKGELVCRGPFPTIPLGFLNDPDGARFEGTYFTRFPGIWHHGDFAEWTEHGGMIIHGRSDATLNPGGVRIGTAEIYRQVEQLPEIEESIVVGQPWDNDVRTILFVVMKPGIGLDEALVARLKKQIRDGASPRHVPAKIIEVTDIPRTRSGKIAELAVRDMIMGREVKNREALANPEALGLFSGIEELTR